VQIVTEPDTLDEAVDALVGELLAGGPAAQGEAKRLLREVPRLPPDQVRETTASWIARLRASDEGREGIGAFLERRPPRWLQTHPR
jgi:methylglutaconyl-CoA hydratase